ncbi:MAG: hypothetical protein M1817_001613 [Caeruleum heppii]|nr:MAG: hypothetical protein M1817_001613 [Caeruleum heppii]
MTAPPLTIRNLTSTPVELKLVERYEAPGSHAPPAKGFSHYTNHVAKNLTSLMSNTSIGPKHAELAQNAETFSHQDVSIRVEPFRTCKTDILVSEKSRNEQLRLTFESEGERHRLDTPTPTSESSVLVPLTPNPRFNYTAVYLPSFSHVSVFSSANLASWMSELKDETPLSALSIPGTHNSPTCHRALPSVRCQAVSVREQLDNGVRFLDIRVQPEYPDDPAKDGLILVHGVFPISLTGNKYFRDLVNDVHAFLDRNPSETVIMSVKREGPGKHTDAQLSQKLHDHYTTDGDRWFTTPRVPTLGEARRKIILMRRYTLDDRLKALNDGRGYAIDAEIWAYNTPHDRCPSGAVCVQDFCEVLETENIDRKIQYSEEHLERAASCVCALPATDGTPAATAAVSPPASQPLYVNFLSASNFWKVGCWPEHIAAKLNPATVDFLCRRHHESDGGGGDGKEEVGDGSTGIVVCDWVGQGGDWDLVRCVVGWNARLEMRERGGVGGVGEKEGNDVS